MKSIDSTVAESRKNSLANSPSGSSTKSSGGFNTNMLAQAAKKSVASTSQDSGSDSDDGGWSDDESSPNPVNQGSHLQPGNRHPSGAVIKKAVARPPLVSSKPPPKPAQVSRPNSVNVKPTDAQQQPLPTNSAVSPRPPPNPNFSGDAPPPRPPPVVANAPRPPPQAPTTTETSATTETPAATDRPSAPSPAPSESTEHSLPPPPQEMAKATESNSSARVTSAMREQSRISQLEQEVMELRKKLERAEARLVHKDGSAGVLSREVEMENELREAQDRINVMKIEKNRLDQSVKELHARLVELESASPSKASLIGNSSHSDIVSMELALKRGEKEKHLENALQRTKAEKDKAIRVIVQIVGKDEISKFLNNNAGSVDILDKLIDYVGKHHSNNNKRNRATVTRTINSNRSKSAGPASTREFGDKHSQQKVQKSPAHYRSRIDEYYRSAITGRDY